MLRLVKPRQPSPNWSIRGTYLGRYVNRSAKTGKRALALKVLKDIERQIERGEFAEPGEPTFAGAALAYMKAGGERTYVRRLLDYFGDTPLSHIEQSAIDGAAVALYPNGSAANRNRAVYTPVSAILRRSGMVLNLRRPKGAGGNKQTAWLWPEQAEAIFAEAEKVDREFAALLVLLCYTGLRLGEALGLTWDNTRLQDGYAYVPDTKNSEPRAVFLPPVAVAALGNLGGGNTGRVFGFHKSGASLSPTAGDCVQSWCRAPRAIRLPHISTYVGDVDAKIRRIRYNRFGSNRRVEVARRCLPL